MPVKGGGFGGFVFKSGTTPRTTPTGQVNTSSLSYVKAKEITIANDTSILGGIVKVSLQGNAATAGYTCYFRVYVNDVAVGVEHTTSVSSFTTWTDDIAVKAGDRVAIYYKMTTGATLAGMQNFNLQYDTIPNIPTFQTITV